MRRWILTGDNAKHWKSQLHSRADWLWIWGLLLAALLLYTKNLGDLPLRDWDEGTVAQVAREIWRSPANWLHPKTIGGEPYLNKPPLMHWLIALTYTIGGVNEQTSRLPGALLTALSIPILYSIGREIFHDRTPAIFSALVYLVMLPVLRHGRLAMLDGAIVSFFLFTVWCLLRSRRNLRYCLGVGIGLGLIGLTKGMVGLLLGAIALLFLFWDTPRLLGSWYLWGGIAIGSLPVAAWYAAQWWQYGHQFTDRAVVDQSLSRIWQAVENHQHPPWFYLLEILKYCFPWLIFLPSGLLYTWNHRNWSWAKLILVWGGGYLLVISLMGTKLPWYVLPVYPAIALAVGVQLAQFWQQPYPAKYPRYAIAFLTLLAVVTWAASLYYSPWNTDPDWELQWILAAVAGTMTLSAWLAVRGERQFIIVLIWGMYVALLLFVTSHHWVWELAEAYQVKPVAALIQARTPPNREIYTSFAYNRPSLDFYSDRRVISSSFSQLQQRWQQPQPFLLLDRSTLNRLQLPSVKSLGQASGWTLVTREKS
ncbi:glycosyltransferase family 39 protein [Chroococcidiopsis sp. FACHB-1243]|uniref:ArnT family glycosyltransferase n=1 Tax=Chroococcidiopsis sp. [FACHB-1243] TaxID=2692781 RepID=UPI00177DAF27|nr:glycosyltransferase family 39 protein [Chroococcidiopsis sp. [FACHB-1243]]MBD2304890.1 glycosyltransferase family 39 protein [Chroococcidiopsis sp. [FACHB-1243]]